MSPLALRRTALALAVLGAVLAWISTASTLFVWLGGLAPYFPRPWLGVVWLRYAAWHATNTHWTNALLVLSAAPMTAAYGLIGAAAWRPMARRARLRWRARTGLACKERGPTDNHGHADWASIAGMHGRFPGPHPDYGGIVVGEAYRVDQDGVAAIPFDPRNPRTWGQGGTAPLLIDPCEQGSGHSLMVVGSGGYKTTSAVSTLLHWSGAAVVLDPKCKLGAQLRRARQAMGQRVFVLKPGGNGPNVLDWIDTRADALAEIDVRTVVTWICREESKDRQNDVNAFYADLAKDLIACLLADMLWDAACPERTLRTLRAGVCLPAEELKPLLRSIRGRSRSRMARDLASSLTMDDKAGETFENLRTTANRFTNWLSIQALADLVSGDAFKAADLAGGALTVSVELPLDLLKSTPQIARVLVGALMNAVYKAARPAGRVLFLIDEAARLERLSPIEVARDAGRESGIVMLLLYQALGQLHEIWGKDGTQSFFASASSVCFAAIADWETAEYVSKMCGEHSVLAYSEGQNTGTSSGMNAGNRSRGINTNVHEIKRRLISPAELLQDTRADELFVMPRGGKPIRCGRAISFRRPEMAARIDKAP